MYAKTTDTPAPTEVLIPEARHHRRRRYLRTGFLAVICALVIAGLIATVVVLTSGPAADGKARPPTAAASASAGVLYIRPVFCTAAPYDPAAPSTPSTGLTCATTLTAQNLDVRPLRGAQGYTSNNVPPDLALAGVPSTKVSSDKPYLTVLLPGLNRQQRYLLGPAQMTSGSIASAVATRNAHGQWQVNFTTTSSGLKLWDTVAEQNFHQFLAIELGGVVYSAAIIQPTQGSFTSFNGKGAISGGLTKADATRLAHAINQQSG